MKNYKYILLLALMLSLFSCTKEFLNKTPQDEISTQDFWKTPADLKLYVNQFYTMLPTFPGYGGGYLWDDNQSDNMLPEAYDTRLSGLNTINSNSGLWDFSRLRSINIMLANYPKVVGPEDEINLYVGEALFFRAYFYFNMVKNYGNVPWLDKPLNADSEELKAPRTPRNEVVDHILEDMDKAISYLPERKNAESNRINKEAAMLFKSRVALFEGTWEKYHQGTPFGVEGSNGENYLQIAVNSARSLMDLGTVQIYSTGKVDSDYRNLFNRNDLSEVSEAILWKKYDVGLGLDHNYQPYACRLGSQTGLTKALVDSYLCVDGRPISISLLYEGDHSLEDVIANRDPRLQQIIWLNGEPTEIAGGQVVTTFDKPDLEGGGNARNTSGYQLKKGADPTSEGVQVAYHSETANIIFRYAEALLNYAEAKAELGTITQEDINISINKLRSRVGMPDLNMAAIQTDSDWDFPSLSPIINEVRRERRVEFGCEGYRFDDLLRWRAADLIIGKRPKGAWFDQTLYPELVVGETILVDDDGYIDPYQKASPNGWNFNPERDYLLPVPPDQITLNNNLDQNPKW